MKRSQFCRENCPGSCLSCFSLNLLVTLPFSFFGKLISSTSKLFFISLNETFRSCFSTPFRAVFRGSSLFIANSLNDMFDVALSHFRGNSNGLKAIWDCTELNIPSKAVLNNLLACGGNVQSIRGITSCVTHI